MEPVRSPEDVLRIGFERSRVVIVNECHNGDQHCARTRHVGRRLLPVAHELGVRNLAMEALHPWFAQIANRSRELPVTNARYLGQDDLRWLTADALSLGWELVAYECDFSKWRGRIQRDVAFANWRDLEEARNLSESLARSSGHMLLVWLWKQPPDEDTAALSRAVRR